MNATLAVAQATFGLFMFMALAWVCSENRRKFDLKTVVLGLCLQVVLATVILKIGFVQNAFLFIANGIRSNNSDQHLC